MLTLLSGLARRYAGVRPKPVALAGGAGFVLERHGAVLGVIGFETAHGRITELNLMVDPAKPPSLPVSSG